MAKRKKYQRKNITPAKKEQVNKGYTPEELLRLGKETNKLYFADETKGK